MSGLRMKSAFAFLLLLGLVHPPGAPGQYRVVAYYPMWTRYTLPPQAIRYDLLTHILHAFAWPDTDASLQFHEATVDTELINSAHRAGCKILLSFGGAGSIQTANLALVTADTAKRRAFINNIVLHLTAYHYDGADLDWEWPQSSSERANEAAFIRELRDAFTATHLPLLISMSVGVTDYQGQWHDFATLEKSVDWFNAMAFNFHGSWSTHAGHNAPLFSPRTDFDGNVDAGIAYLHNTRGIPTQQLALGLPFFGRRFQASSLYGPKTEPTVDIVYTDALADLNQNWRYMWDSVSQVPYLVDGSGKYLDTFDDSTSLSVKCNYAKSHNLSGVMIWTLGQDLTQGRQPLLESVGKAMISGPDAISPQEKVVPQEYALMQNFPNPFNPSTVIKYTVAGAGPSSASGGGRDSRSASEADRRGSGLGARGVSLVVFDVLGREVAVLVDERKAAGTYSVRFDASTLASGVYVYRLTAGSFIQSRKMILLR